MGKDQALATLGLNADADLQAVRHAFVRLARIYHPDRFAGQPEDARAEAERRMKAVTAAYEVLRASVRRPLPGMLRFPITEDLLEKARKRREEAAAREAEEQRDRIRWLRWEEIERQARARAEWESAYVTGSTSAADETGRRVEFNNAELEPPRQVSALSRRLDQARRRDPA